MLDTNDYGYYFFFLAAIRCHRTKYIKPITACKFNPPIWYRSLWSGYAVNDNGGSPNINCCSFCRGWDWGALWCVPLGLFAANWRGGFIDDGIMRFNDLVFAFPSLVIAILITAIAGPSAFNAIVAIGIFNIPVFARISRGAALSLWQREFILSAQVAGKTGLRISTEHVLPNLMHILIVQATIQFSLGILAEAGLSYIGLGAQPPTPSWGRMLADAQTMVSLAPRLAIVPGVAIIITVLGLNLLGDGLRDALDPKLRGSMKK